MTSAVFDFKAIAVRCAQLRGEAPSGRVFEKMAEGSLVLINDPGPSPSLAAAAQEEINAKIRGMLRAPLPMGMIPPSPGPTSLEIVVRAWNTIGRERGL